MKTRFMIENPQEIEATMKITMRVKEWEELRDQLNDKDPLWKLSGAITQLLIDARRVIYPEEKEVS